VNRLCWRLVDLVSRMLEPDEREAVRGDLAESGETGEQALRGLLGLVVRRQVVLWKDWRSWLALLGAAGLVCALLMLAIFLGDAYELYSWIIRNYSVIDKAILAQTGLTLRHGIVTVVCTFFLLISCASTGGFVLASLSRTTVWLHTMVFCLVWMLLPLKLFTVLSLLPFIWGVTRGLRLRTLRPPRSIFLAAAIVSMTALTMWTWGWWRAPAWAHVFLSLALCWPAWHLVATASPQLKENNT
jgi:hypothetical protein